MKGLLKLLETIEPYLRNNTNTVNRYIKAGLVSTQPLALFHKNHTQLGLKYPSTQPNLEINIPYICILHAFQIFNTHTYTYALHYIYIYINIIGIEFYLPGK